MGTAQKDKFENAASSMGERAKGAASEAGTAIKDAVTETGSRAKEAIADAGHKVSETAGYLGKKAEEATSAVGSGLKQMAGSLREHTPDKGMFGAASSAVADTLESGGKYLQQHGMSGIGEDMTNLIRRNPLPAFLIGIGIGFLVAKATHATRS